MIQEQFQALVASYTNNQQLTKQLVSEIETAYSQPERHFHNLSHLEQMNAVLEPVRSQVEDWETLLLSVVYHDFVYDVVEYVTDNNNEDKSALKAEEFLKSIGFPLEKIERCQQHILATKKHRLSADNDTNFLTDADLSILGQPWEIYDVYRKNIRLEYSIFPDSIFHAGRTKVLNRFLQMERLFKTDFFYNHYETAAKENISRELEIISFA